MSLNTPTISPTGFNEAVNPEGWKAPFAIPLGSYFSSLAQHRHAADREAKRLVQEEWLKDITRFRTSEEAGQYFADWLVTVKKCRRYKPRTICRWLTEIARSKKIRWR